ncbi:hypothetical protein CGCSCA5_v005497 [Colletotrichum siamense]|nr:hypothetical protein CGCSCA5_v005497 [Colletotrichum siamense]
MHDAPAGVFFLLQQPRPNYLSCGEVEEEYRNDAANPSQGEWGCRGQTWDQGPGLLRSASLFRLSSSWEIPDLRLKTVTFLSPQCHR